MEKVLLNKPPAQQRLSVRENTYQKLKEAIFSNRFVAGERLAEEQLAAELGVSRTPVREALHRLEQDGFIEPLGKRGFCIPDNSPEEIRDIFALRAALEGHALRLICRRITDEQIGLLQEIVNKAEIAMLQKKVDDLSRANVAFHDALMGMIAYKCRFYNFIVNMRQYVLRYRKNTLTNFGVGERCVDGHRMILLALKLRDEDLCEKVMKRHIQISGEEALRLSLGKLQ
ncbi:MAG: GntR family transcriptional regulator [Syntrophobacterales bacterium]|nr:GntR family transcriptional regulator [Syntrophobacterales bacterium]